MLCQECGKHPATTHVKTMINGEINEYDLCPACAQKKGYGNMGNLFQGFGGFENPFFSLNNLFGSFLGTTPMLGGNSEITHCPVCGATFRDISESGRVGCSDCYQTFYDQLLPSIQRMHGNTCHTGKVPTGNAMQVAPEVNLTVADVREPSKEETELARLQNELQAAIEEQDFEQAAVLRDKIKEYREGKGAN